jgi:D-alanyl-D-alanine carboxypeptidase
VATVIAESMAGSEEAFAAQMTRRARSLGMRQSNFANASGLPDPYQVTTAWDMMRLAQALQTQHRQYYRYFSAREFYFGRRVFRNHNRLLYDYPGTDGIKTGFIRSAGYNLVASAQRGGRRLIGVVLGGTSRQGRNEDMRYLLDSGFAQLGVGGPVYAATPYGSGQTGIWRNVSNVQPVTAFNPEPARSRPIPYGELQRVAPAERVRVTLDPNDAWKVDVGLFDSRNEAQQQIEQVVTLAPRLLSYDQVTLRNVNHDGRRLVRVIFDNLSRENAGYACRTLRQQQQDCILLPPGT